MRQFSHYPAKDTLCQRLPVVALVAGFASTQPFAPSSLGQDFLFCPVTIRFRQFLFEIDLGAIIGIKRDRQAVHALLHRLPGGFGFWTVSNSEDYGCELAIGLEVVIAFDEEIEVCLTHRSNLSV